MNTYQPSRIIVAGKIYVASGSRAEFIKRSLESVRQARKAAGCIDFAVSADLVESDRVNVFEIWTSKQALHEFRGSGHDDKLSQFIVRVEIGEYLVTE